MVYCLIFLDHQFTLLTAKNDEPSLAANTQQAGRNCVEQISSSPRASETQDRMVVT
jgi:hypothetical protein